MESQKDMVRKYVLYVIATVNFFFAFHFVFRNFYLRHDSIQILSELLTSQAGDGILPRNYAMNLNLGFPTWITNELLFGNDPILFVHLFLSKKIGFTPEYALLLFYILIHLSNCFFMYLSLYLMNKNISRNIVLISVYLLSAPLMSISTQGHGVLYLSRYFSIYLYILLLIFQKGLNRNRITMLLLVLSLELTGYQSIIQILAEILVTCITTIFLFKKSFKPQRISHFLKRRKFLIIPTLIVLIVSLIPLYIAVNETQKNYNLGVRQFASPYYLNIVNSIFIPYISHGELYFPLIILLYLLISLLRSKKNTKFDRKKTEYEKISSVTLVKALAFSVLLMSAVGSFNLKKAINNNNHFVFGLNIQTLFGIRNWGFLSSIIIYITYLCSFILLLNAFEKQKVSKLRTKKIEIFFIFLSILMSLESISTVLNQKDFKDNGKKPQWHNISTIKFDQIKHQLSEFKDYYPYVYNLTELSSLSGSVQTLTNSLPRSILSPTIPLSDFITLKRFPAIFNENKWKNNDILKNSTGFYVDVNNHDGTFTRTWHPSSEIPSKVLTNYGTVPQNYLLVNKNLYIKYLNFDGSLKVLDKNEIFYERYPIQILNSYDLQREVDGFGFIVDPNFGQSGDLNISKRSGNSYFVKSTGCQFFISAVNSVIQFHEMKDCENRILLLQLNYNQGWKLKNNKKIQTILVNHQYLGITLEDNKQDTITLYYQNTAFDYALKCRYFLILFLSVASIATWQKRTI